MTVRTCLAAFTVCDEAGKLLFTAADVEALGAKSCAALDRIYETALSLNRLRVRDIEEIRKNS